MSWHGIRQILTGAAFATAMLLPVPMFSQATTNADAVGISNVLPLAPGTRWTYAGKVEWTVPNSDKVKRAEIRWVTEVVDIAEGSGWFSAWPGIGVSERSGKLSSRSQTNCEWARRG